MIISHKHEFIFFAVPKTATHAVRELLRMHMGSRDWEQQALYGKQALPIPALAKLIHGHISVREIKPHLDLAVWQSYIKFGFVRNPYDRFISVCFFLNRNNEQFAGQPLSWMKAALGRDQFRQRILVRPQYQQLVDHNGDIALDYVARYESIDDSVAELSELLNLPLSALPTKNTSEHGAYTAYYDDELREMVSEFYQGDFKMFCYNHDNE